MKEPFRKFIESELGASVLLITCGLPATWKTETSEEISKIKGYPILQCGNSLLAQTHLRSRGIE